MVFRLSKTYQLLSMIVPGKFIPETCLSQKIKYVRFYWTHLFFIFSTQSNHILLTCRKNLRDLIIWDHKTILCELLNCPLVFSNVNLAPPLLTEVPVPSQESERSYICVLGVSPLSMFFLFEFRIVPTVWWFSLYHIKTFLNEFVNILIPIYYIVHG